jgi:hypothetical protein
LFVGDNTALTTGKSCQFTIGNCFSEKLEKTLSINQLAGGSSFSGRKSSISSVKKSAECTNPAEKSA